MVTTKQDGDEDSFEYRSLSVEKATESRNEVQKVSEDTRIEQEVTNNTKHGIRSAEGDEQTVQSRCGDEDRKARCRSHSRKFSREVLQRTSRDNQ